MILIQAQFSADFTKTRDIDPKIRPQANLDRFDQAIPRSDDFKLPARGDAG
jgi:hypothetical protein